jgi:hypothetical protein
MLPGLQSAQPGLRTAGRIEGHVRKMRETAAKKGHVVPPVPKLTRMPPITYVHACLQAKKENVIFWIVLIIFSEGFSLFLKAKPCYPYAYAHLASQPM